MIMIFRLMILLVALVSITANAHAVVSETNGIYNLYVGDSDEIYQKYGVYTVGTGADHPFPGENVLYGGNTGQYMTSFLTVRSYTSQTDYTTKGALYSAFARERLTDYSPVVTSLPGGLRTSWAVSNRDSLSVVQDTVIEGTELEDSRVRVTTTVTNTSASPVSVGIRYMWDWKIAGADDSAIKRHNPNDPVCESIFFEEYAPSFSYYEGTKDGEPFSDFGTCIGPVTMVPPPTPPDLFYYCSYHDGNQNAWTFDVSAGEAGDSAVCYFWGDTEERAVTLDADESYSVTQYISTYEEPFVEPVQDPSPPEPSGVPVPTLSGWGIAILASAVAGLGLYGIRRWQGNDSSGH